MERVADLLKSKIISAAEAAEYVEPGMCVLCSGFSQIGYPSAIPREIARLGKAKDMFLITSAGVGDSLNGIFAQAGLVTGRAPYQGNRWMRDAVNNGDVAYCDYHLSDLPVKMRSGAGPKPDIAIVECLAVSEKGFIPVCAIGTVECFAAMCDKILLEVNYSLSEKLIGMHDMLSCFSVSQLALSVKRREDRGWKSWK